MTLYGQVTSAKLKLQSFDGGKLSVHTHSDNYTVSEKKNDMAVTE